VNIYLQGLQISILGLLITFSALGIFVLVMMVLLKVFPYKPEPEEAGEEDVVEPEGISSVAQDADIVAVIAAAVAFVKFQRQGALGSNLVNGRGSWWNSNLQVARRSGQTRK
jgi:sodium pump decarboxylase gamma subunit